MADEGEVAPSADGPAPASDTSKEHREATMAGSLQASRSGPSAKRPREAGEADETDPPAEREKSARGGDAPAGGAAAAPAASAPAAAAAAAADDGDGRQDERVGFPSRYPACGPHMHGWFLETHKRVFNQLLRGDDVKVILELGSW